jgi:hypothetical protein
MLTIKKKLFPLIILLGFTLTIAGCKTQLAPDYDKAIVESVTSTSEKTMTFLARVADGTSATDFAKREQHYNELIGSFDALEIHAKARPIPSNRATKRINKILGTKGKDPLSSDYPSAFAFEKLSETLKKMKETDKEKGLTPTVVNAFRGQIEIYLDQAITYESFLNR